jgi:aspartyl-tRNA(Asn)/glutamyl-tRNA(Gln) amidotransferase subunit C
MDIKMDVRKIAKLAHLEITEEEAELYGPQMDKIVSYVEQLNELDTEDIEPAIGGLIVEGQTTYVMRDDVPHEPLGQELALSQAPDAEAGYFRVPKVL